MTADERIRPRVGRIVEADRVARDERHVAEAGLHRLDLSELRDEEGKPIRLELNTQYGKEGKDVIILGISVDDPVDKLKPYASRMKMNYPVLVGAGRDDVQDAFGPLWGIPVTVFIDRDGRIAKKHSGIASKEQFEQEIKALL